MSRGLTVAFALRRYGEAAETDGLSRIERASLGGSRAPERAAALQAAHRAAVRLNPQWTADVVEVLRQELTAPLLRIAARRTGVRVSLAHGDGLAAAALSTGACG